MVYLRFSKESDLKSGTPLSYTNNLAGPGVVGVMVSGDRNKIEQYVQYVL